MHLSHSSKPAFLLRAFLLLAIFVSFASGNTEIRNFAVSASGHGPQDSNPRLASSARRLFESHLHAELHRLNATHNEGTFRVVPAPLGTSLEDVCESQVGVEVGRGEGCPHELWLELDLSSKEWIRYERFTIRLSWPAFYPTDFDIQLLSPKEFMKYMGTRLHLQGKGELKKDIISTEPDLNTPDPPRTMFARVRLVDTGVRPPSKSKFDKYPNQAKQERSEAVPFNIIVEPLILGVIPATVVPTILFSIPLLTLTWLVYPYAMRYLESVASEAKKELYGPQLQKTE